jgi:hypothetical protein
MEIKKYIEKIMASDNEDKKDQLIYWICDNIEQEDKDIIEIELYETAEGRVLDEERAEQLINKMKPFGMKWTLADTEGVRTSYGYEDIRPVDF